MGVAPRTEMLVNRSQDPLQINDAMNARNERPWCDCSAGLTESLAVLSSDTPGIIDPECKSLCPGDARI